jgi:processive 1,2-diacylglycerol beta-glucosyltransferase
VFAEKKDKQEMRVKHGLEVDRTTILLSAGGFGVGSVEPLIDALKPLKARAQVVAICGRNEDLRRRLVTAAARTKPIDNVLIKPIGYTNEMDEYMTASDLVLGKPGGLTTSEAMSKGLAFVIVDPIPGQEERNSDHLLEEGMAIRCNNLPTLSYKLGNLLDDRQRVARMQANSKRLGHPNAARDIVNRVMEFT